jgi:hypothetical protein
VYDTNLAITPAPGGATASIGEFIAGGIAALRGAYRVGGAGTVNLLAYAGLTADEVGTVRTRLGLPAP